MTGAAKDEDVLLGRLAYLTGSAAARHRGREVARAGRPGEMRRL